MKALSVGGNGNPRQLTQKKGNACVAGMGRGVYGVYKHKP